MRIEQGRMESRNYKLNINCIFVSSHNLEVAMQVVNKDFILKTLAEKRHELKRYGVKEIGLFGSYVRNDANSDSDVDILVDLEKGHKTFRNFLALNYFLENLLGAKVDLVTKQSLSPYIGPHILNTVYYVSFGH